MTRCKILFAALLLAAPAAAQEQEKAVPAGGSLMPDLIDPESDPAQFDAARKKVVDCEGEKFTFAWGVGARPTKVTLCSKKGATRDEVIRMLEEAANKLEQTASIAEDRRVAIVQQIRAQISQLTGISVPAAESVARPITGPAVTVPTSSLASNDRVPTPAPEYGNLPTISPVVSKPPAQTAAPRPRPAKPRLSFQCYTPGEIGSGGPCTIMGRDTRLTVRAGEALPAGIALRFQRNDEPRAEVALNAMRAGQSVQLVMPRQVCAGVVEAETRIDVVRGGFVVDSVGPALLRC